MSKPRGRPPRANKSATERIEIRVTRLERAAWEHAAAQAGISVSEWIRQRAWVGTATGRGASENLDEKLRAAQSRGQWTAVAVAIENGRLTDITADVIGPTAPQLEAALRYLWDAWSEAEGSGQPEDWVFGPDAEMRTYYTETGVAPSYAPSEFSEWREAPPEIQETIRRVIGERNQQEPPWQCLTCGRSRAEVADCTAGDFCPLKRREL